MQKRKDKLSDWEKVREDPGQGAVLKVGRENS